jgi:hypothetical protein
VKDKVGDLPAPHPHGRRNAPVAQAGGGAEESPPPNSPSTLERLLSIFQKH